MTLDGPWPSDRPFRGSEAVRAGLLTWDDLRGPRFRRLGPDIHVAADVPDSTGLAIRAQALRAGPSAVVTGWSACWWWGCDVLPRPEPPVEVDAPDRRLRSSPGVLFRRARVRAEDVAVREGVRLTTPLRTAYDLARRVPLEDAVVAADALGRRARFTGAHLGELASTLGPLRGDRAVARVADLMDPAAESPMETRTRVVIVRAGLPRPVSQFCVRDGGRFVARVDLAWPEWKIAVEYDGHDHAAADRRGRDVDRIDALRRLGWIVIVVTSRQYATRGWIERRVREAMDERGAVLV
jgi:hypothetical protein